MSHFEQQIYIEEIKHKFPSFFEGRTVLEVGSLNINGTVRDNFKNCNYTGIDIGAGACVDVVCGGQEYGAPNNTFDTVISCECFEHNPFWSETFINMHRMCKPGGLIVFTCAGEGRAEHGTSRTDTFSSPLTVEKGWDYYKNLSPKDFYSIMDMYSMFSLYEFSIIRTDLRFWGIKK